MRSQVERPANVRYHDRWARHPIHSREVETCKCAAAHRHARLARIDHRTAQDHRTADESDGTWRERFGRVPYRHPLDTRLRLLGKADGAQLGDRHDRPRLGRADATPWLYA